MNHFIEFNRLFIVYKLLLKLYNYTYVGITLIILLFSKSEKN